MRDDAAYLHYIDESIDLVLAYSKDGYQHFLSSAVNQDAIIRRLETIADASAQLSDALKARHPEIEWQKIKGFRNQVAHGYIDIDLDRVWEAVGKLSELQALIKQELG